MLIDRFGLIVALYGKGSNGCNEWRAAVPKYRLIALDGHLLTPS
jgi:hypothetical protein